MMTNGLGLVFIIACMHTCTCHPHVGQRSHQRHLVERGQPINNLCIHTHPTNIDHNFLSRNLRQLQSDVNDILLRLACKLDSSCSMMLLDIIAGGVSPTAHPVNVNAHLSLQDVAIALRRIYVNVTHIADEVHQLQDDLVLDASDPVRMLTNVLLNDLKSIICSIENVETATQAREDGYVYSAHMDETLFMKTYVRILKDLSDFVSHVLSSV